MSLMTEYEYCYSVAMPAKRWLDCSGKGILFTSTHTEYHVVPCSHRISFVALLWKLSNGFVPFCCGTHTCTQCWRWGHTTQSRGDNSSPHPVAVLGLLHPRAWLDLLAARAHCWLIFHLLSTRTPRFLPRKVLSSLLSPSLCIYPGLPHPRCRIWNLLLLNIIWLIIPCINHMIDTGNYQSYDV